MKTKHPLLLLFVLTASLFITCAFMPPTVHIRVPALPDRLLIDRSPGFSSDSVQEMVKHPLLVQQLYFHTLTLPPAPEHQVCPLYIIAEYNLTFLRQRTSILKANVFQGGCPTVTLRSGDKRAPDELFWSLLKKASDAGAQNSSALSSWAGSPTFMKAP